MGGHALHSHSSPMYVHLSIYVYTFLHSPKHLMGLNGYITELPSSPEKNKYKNNSSYPKSENSNKNNDDDVKV